MTQQPVALRRRTPAEVRAFLEGETSLPLLLPDPGERRDFINEAVAAAERFWTRERIPPPSCAEDTL